MKLSPHGNHKEWVAEVKELAAGLKPALGYGTKTALETNTETGTPKRGNVNVEETVDPRTNS